MPCDFKDHTLNTVLSTVFAHTPHEALSVAMAKYRLSYDGHGNTARINDIRISQDSNLIPGHFKIQIGAMFDDNPWLYTGSVRPARPQDDRPKLFMPPEHLARLEKVEADIGEIHRRLAGNIKILDAHTHQVQNLIDNLDDRVRNAIRNIVAL
jgi:hypothetical protein